MSFRNRLSAQGATSVESDHVVIDVTLGHPGALAFRAAALEGDWATAASVFAQAGTWDERDLLIRTTAEVDGRPEAVHQLAPAHANNPLARLVRGAHGVMWAWQARGRSYGEDVTPQAWRAFFDRLREAELDLMAAARGYPDDPIPWTFLVTSGRGLQIPVEEIRLRHEQGARRAPELFALHAELLQGICGKWYGSHDDMFELARTLSVNSPDGSPNHAHLVTAHLEYWIARDTETTDGYFPYHAKQELMLVAQRSVFHPSFGRCRDYAGAMRAVNLFAAAFWLAEEYVACRHLMDAIGTRFTAFPWNCLGEPEDTIPEIRRGIAERIAAGNRGQYEFG